MNDQPLDARETKPLYGGASFSLGHRLFRGVWCIVWWALASWTPPPLHPWRGWLLRVFGATIHPSARVYGSAKVWYPPNLHMNAHSVLGPKVTCYCMDRVVVGERAIVSQGVHLCAGTHDICDRDFQLVTSPIMIGPDAWIAAEAFIGPGVTVAEGAVVGARGVLFRNADRYGVYVGNPAHLIKTRQFRTGE